MVGGAARSEARTRAASRVEVVPGQGGYLVGDTGLEPVTSSVSGKLPRRSFDVSLSRVQVRS